MTPKLRATLPLLLDLVVPIGGYFLLSKAFGVDEFWALAISGTATGIATAVNTVRARKVDAFGLLILLELALSLVVLAVTDDPRIILLKPGFLIGVAGIYALVTCFTGKPLVYESGKPFATKGDPAMLAAYERAWDRSALMRRTMRAVTAVWAAAFLVDAVVRTVIVLSFSAQEIDESFLLSQAPLIALLVLAIAYTRLRMRPLRPIVEAQLEPSAR
ncbi:VC0807 family protein [Amycolatopsis minnesotensis]|uniref:Intracellular septation protein A n=1 Tax=Amycolatopsis minnesotensis TaxID=337894 RepID=A0ABN2SBE2_9PSEU